MPTTLFGKETPFSSSTWQEIHALYLTCCGDRESQYILYTPQDLMAIKDRIAIVVEDESVIGLAIFIDMASWGYTDMVCIHPDYRRRGLGKSLHLALEAKHPNWKMYELAVDPDNHAAVELSKKLGYGNDRHLIWKYKPAEKVAGGPVPAIVHMHPIP